MNNDKAKDQVAEQDRLGPLVALGIAQIIAAFIFFLLLPSTRYICMFWAGYWVGALTFNYTQHQRSHKGDRR